MYATLGLNFKKQSKLFSHKVFGLKFVTSSKVHQHKKHFYHGSTVGICVSLDLGNLRMYLKYCKLIKRQYIARPLSKVPVVQSDYLKHEIFSPSLQNAKIRISFDAKNNNLQIAFFFLDCCNFGQQRWWSDFKLGRFINEIPARSFINARKLTNHFQFQVATNELQLLSFLAARKMIGQPGLKI